MPNLTPVQSQWVTLAFILVVTAVVVGYDIAWIRLYGVDASISRVLRRAFTAHPVLYAAVLVWLGILIGHIGLCTIIPD